MSLQDRSRVFSDAVGAFAEATTDYARLLETIAQTLAESVGDRCMVLLLSEDGQTLALGAVYDVDPEVRSSVHAAFSEPLAIGPIEQRVVDTGEAFLGMQMDSDPVRGSITVGRAQFPDRIAVHGVLTIALRARRRTLGLLTLTRHQRDRPSFDEHDRALAHSLADHAAVAIANARLCQEHHEQLQLAKEAAERAFAESDRSNRLKDRVLAAVSHDLRAPLATIILWAKAMRDDPAVRSRALDAIHESAAAQSRMIDDLLDVSRAMSGQLHIDSRPVVLAHELQSVLDRIGPAAAARSVTIEAGIEPGLGEVIGDRHRLRQTLETLLTNALSFTENGGRILVSGRRTGPMIEIAVSDSGLGLCPESAPRLLEAFNRGDDPLTYAHGGLGLGLSVARQLVELHGGALLARSDGPGPGATFTLTIPAVVRPPAPAPVARVQSSSLQGIRVLVVDDNEDIREALEVVLGGAGAIVECVASASAAWTALLEARHDVVVSDVLMPDSDGYSLARRIRATVATRGVAAVVLTASTSAADVERALAAGFDAHVAKPSDFETLAAAISSAIASRRVETA